MLGLACKELNNKAKLDGLQIGGLIWLLQLWLSATFESSLETRAPLNPKLGIEGIRIAKLTHDDGKVISLEVFENYFQMFYMCKTFTSIMTLFSNRWCGPEWFRKPFPNLSQ